MEILTRKYYADKVGSWLGKGNIIYVDKEKKAFKNIKTKDDLDTYID